MSDHQKKTELACVQSLLRPTELCYVICYPLSHSHTFPCDVGVDVLCCFVSLSLSLSLSLSSLSLFFFFCV